MIKNTKKSRNRYQKRMNFRSTKSEGNVIRAHMREDQIKRLKKTSRRIDTVAAVLAFLSGVIVYNEVK